MKSLCRSSCFVALVVASYHTTMALSILPPTSLSLLSSTLLPAMAPSATAPGADFQVAGVLSEADLWAIRIASAMTTYFGFVLVSDRPRGSLQVQDPILQVKTSQVPGAGLGLFVTQTLPKGTILGTYPGVVVPLQQNLNKLKEFPMCEGYIWRFSDNQFVIDPTNSQGVCDDFCTGGNPSMPLSRELFNILPFLKVPTTLCRINEPPKGLDVNVVTDEDRKARSVTFSLERDVYAGEELFIDYGLFYDRSQYTKS